MGPGFCPLSRTNGTFLHNILESIDLSPILGPVQCEYTIIQLLFILNNFDSLTATPPNIPTGGRPCLSESGFEIYSLQYVVGDQPGMFYLEKFTKILTKVWVTQSYRIGCGAT